MEQRCREPGCEETELAARGLCGRCYQRHLYHGRLDEVAPPPEKSCEHCGKTLTTSRRWTARFCSSECSHKAKYEKIRQANGRKRETCKQCGASLEGLRPQALFCSAKCGSDNHNARSAEKVRANRKPCVHCGEPLPLKRQRFCSQACNLAHRRPEKYGLTPDELVALLAQHEVCAICGTAKWGKKGPQVDHCHDSGRVRGVLCVNCNTLLGHAKDDPERLRAALRYLE